MMKIIAQSQVSGFITGWNLAVIDVIKGERRIVWTGKTLRRRPDSCHCAERPNVVTPVGWQRQ